MSQVKNKLDKATEEEDLRLENKTAKTLRIHVTVPAAHTRAFHLRVYLSNETTRGEGKGRIRGLSPHLLICMGQRRGWREHHDLGIKSKGIYTRKSILYRSP